MALTVDDERLSHEMNHKLPVELFRRMADGSEEPLSRQGKPRLVRENRNCQTQAVIWRGGNGVPVQVRPAIESGPCS